MTCLNVRAQFHGGGNIVNRDIRGLGEGNDLGCDKPFGRVKPSVASDKRTPVDKSLADSLLDPRMVMDAHQSTVHRSFSFCIVIVPRVDRICFYLFLCSFFIGKPVCIAGVASCVLVIFILAVQ